MAASAISTSRCLSPTGQPGAAAAGAVLGGGVLAGGEAGAGVAACGCAAGGGISGTSGAMSGVTQELRSHLSAGSATADAVPLDRTATSTAAPTIQRRIDDLLTGYDATGTGPGCRSRRCGTLVR